MARDWWVDAGRSRKCRSTASVVGRVQAIIGVPRRQFPGLAGSGGDVQACTLRRHLEHLVPDTGPASTAPKLAVASSAGSPSISALIGSLLWQAILLGPTRHWRCSSPGWLHVTVYQLPPRCMPATRSGDCVVAAPPAWTCLLSHYSPGRARDQHGAGLVEQSSGQ